MNPYEKNSEGNKNNRTIKGIPLQVPVNLAPRNSSGWLRNKMADAFGESALISSNISVSQFR